jgi:PAS domain S-box-containing protein
MGSGMTDTPTFDEIFAVMSAASGGDTTARVIVPDDLELNDLPTRLAIAVNLLLDDLHHHAAELEAAHRDAQQELERLVSDRTEQLRQSEEKFSKAFQASPAAISIATLPDGRWIEINEALAKMIGYSSEELIGHTSVELGLVDAGSRAKILEAIHTHGTVRNVEIQLHTKSKQIVDVLVSIEQIELNGQACALSIQYDITELKRALREVQRLNDDLEQRQVALLAANQELESFAYSVSHDLRAPLRAIDGFSEILAKNYGAALPDEAHHYLRRVREGAQRMGRLIDDLLFFSRFTRQPLDKHPTSIQETIQQVLDELQGQMEGREIEIALGELPECQADPNMLKQVIANLLDNAIKYTRNRETAHIEIGSRQQEGQTVYFIKDNGVGFDMRFADKLFGVFQRLHRTEDFEGTGIGLATVQRIIQRHGGRIWAESELEQGATFYFTLPELLPMLE